MTYACIFHAGNTCLDILWNIFAFRRDIDRDTKDRRSGDRGK